MTMPCCDPSMSLWDQILSDTCQYCSDSTRQAQQTLQQQEQLTPTQIPSCDSNAGFLANLFSNSCNVDITSQVNSALGLPNVPTWVWALGIGAVGLVVLKASR